MARSSGCGLACPGRCILGLVLVGALAVACNGRVDEPAGGPPAAGPGKSYRLGVIPKGTTHVFWNYIKSGALRGARALEKERGIRVEVLWRGPLVEGDREKQRQVIESFIGQDVDGLVLAPVDHHALAGPVSIARSAGKPVVIIDSGLKGEPGRDYESFVATDNYRGGVLAGQRLGELLGGKGKALLLRYQVGSASTTNREQGFIDTLAKEYPGIELVPPGLEQYAGDTSGKAQARAEALLNAYRDIDGIFCPNESSATGMLQALRNTPMVGKVTFIGFDSNDKLIGALRENQIHGLVLQDPVRMGDLGVRTMVQFLETGKVEPRIDTGVYLVTRENMDQPKYRLLLEPDLSILDEE